MAVGVQQQQRRDTEANWVTSGKVLAQGEIGYATDSHIIKMGDGVNTWDELTIPYDGRYLPIGGKAADSEMLDGISAGGFILVGDADTGAVADKIAKRDGSARMKAAAGAASDDVVNYSQLTSVNVSRVVSAAFTLAATDVGKTIIVNNSSYTAFALNVPINSSVAIPVGSFVDLLIADKGPVLLTPAGGVTVFGYLTMYGAGTTARLFKSATDGWIVTNVCYSPGPILRRKIKTGADNTITSGDFVKLRLDGTDGSPTYSRNVDTLGANEQWSAADNYKIYSRRSGWYTVIAQMTIGNSVSGRIYISAYVNGVAQELGSGTPRTGAAENSCSWTANIPLNVGDYMEFWGYHDGIGSNTVSESVYSHSVVEWAWLRPL